MITVLSVLCFVRVDSDFGGTDVISKLELPKGEDVAVVERGVEDFSAELLELLSSALEDLEAELVVGDSDVDLLPPVLADVDNDVVPILDIDVKEELDHKELDLEGDVFTGAEDSHDEVDPVVLPVSSSKGQ